LAAGLPCHLHHDHLSNPVLCTTSRLINKPHQQTKKSLNQILSHLLKACNLLRVKSTLPTIDHGPGGPGRSAHRTRAHPMVPFQHLLPYCK
jgi:hypothetical protein